MARRGDPKVRGRDIQRVHEQVLELEREQMSHTSGSPFGRGEEQYLVYEEVAAKKGAPFVDIGPSLIPDPESRQTSSVRGKVRAYFKARERQGN